MKGVALRLYKTLESTLTQVYNSKCIVLKDEYDIPLTYTHNKPCMKQARAEYFELINRIFKNNANLQVGLLAGIHPYDLNNITNDPNKFSILPLTVLKSSVQAFGSANPDTTGCDRFGELFTFSRSDTMALVKKVWQQHPSIRAHPVETIMRKITEWQGGYSFGVNTDKFNPHGVLNFLCDLWRLPLDNAARCYQKNTGNQCMVTKVARSNHTIAIILALEFLAEYNANSNGGLAKLDGSWTPCLLQPLYSRTIKLLLTQDYLASCDGEMNINQFVSLLIQRGYLTVRPCGHLVTPNQAIRDMWKDLLANMPNDRSYLQNIHD